MNRIKLVWLVFLTILLSACLGTPDNVKPVNAFDVNRYVGKWYEIARLDNRFERGLEKITADYALKPDGGVSVVNRGYSSQEGKWKEAEGKAYFVDKKDEGYLKVSFFGPFYSSYVVFELEKDRYEYAFISGSDKSYLWLLSRTPHPSQEVIDKFKQQSKALGFKTEDLIFVKHD
ncbi:MAG TPA: lipocalin family protein [Cellvibrionaceae bacterium]